MTEVTQAMHIPGGRNGHPVLQYQDHLIGTYNVPVVLSGLELDDPDSFGEKITPFEFTTTPPPSGKLLDIRYQVNSENGYNQMYIVTKRSASNDEQIMPEAVNANNDRWSGITTPIWDGGNASTPEGYEFSICDTDPWDEDTTYALYIRSSNGSSSSNRIGTTPTGNGDSLECGISSVRTSFINPAL